MNNTRTTQSLLLGILLCFALLGFLRFLLLLIALVLWTRLRFGLGVPLSFFSFFCSLLAQHPHLLYMHSLPPPLFVQHLVGQLTTIVGSISHSTNLHRLLLDLKKFCHIAIHVHNGPCGQTEAQLLHRNATSAVRSKKVFTQWPLQDGDLCLQKNPRILKRTGFVSSLGYNAKCRKSTYLHIHTIQTSNQTLLGTTKY